MSLRLDIINEQTEVPLPEGIEQLLERLLALAGEMEGIDSGDVTLTFVTDEAIQELNRDYRQLDKPTDVLSFSMWEKGEEELDISFGAEEEEPAAADVGNGKRLELPENPIGDIVISVPTALRQSREYGHSLEREIGFLFVHGFLHCIGYDHEDAESERIMIEKQEHVLGQAGLSR